MAGQWGRRGRVFPPRRLLAPALMATVMAVALLTTTSGPLYAEVYPPVIGGPGLPKLGNNLTLKQFVEDADRAFAKAKVLVDTEPSRVIENDPAELTARIVLGRPSGFPGAPTVEVAWENRALLEPAKAGDVEISPKRAVRKRLSECAPRADGGCELDWTWTIVARKTGRQKLLLTIQPVVYVNGHESQGFKEINSSIAIDVLVHPVEKEFEAAQVDLTRMHVDVRPTVTAGSATTVTATLPRSWGGKDLAADIQLATGPGSVPATIRPIAAGPDPPTALTRRWSVKPSGTGVLTLVFTAAVSGQAGDKPLSDKWQVASDVEVNSTLWDRIGGFAVWLGGLVTLALGLIALARYWRDRRPADEAP